jgi:rod shape-determining protein MreC
VLDFDGTRKTRRRDAILALLVLIAAFALVLLPVDYQRPIREGFRSTLLRPFLAAQAQISQRRGGMVDSRQLRAQRDSLAAVVAAQASLSEENRQLRAALGLAHRLGDRYVAANVIRPGLTTAESTFLVDVGREHGVFVGSPVFTADGLLGMVLEVDDRASQAVDWTHPEFRVNAMTDDGAAYGIIVPRRGRVVERRGRFTDLRGGLQREDDVLALTGTAFQVDVRPGRRVVSSGRGRLIPRGMLIGTVIGIEEADTGWRKSYLVRPAVRPENALHVLVGTREGYADLSELWQVSAPPDPAFAEPPEEGSN